MLSILQYRKFQTEQRTTSDVRNLPTANHAGADLSGPDLDLTNSLARLWSMNNIVLLAIDGDMVNATSRAALASPEHKISWLSGLAGDLVALSSLRWVLSFGCAWDGGSCALLDTCTREARAIHVAALGSEGCLGLAGTKLILRALVRACTVDDLLRGSFA